MSYKAILVPKSQFKRKKKKQYLKSSAGPQDWQRLRKLVTLSVSNNTEHYRLILYVLFRVEIGKINLRNM